VSSFRQFSGLSSEVVAVDPLQAAAVGLSKAQFGVVYRQATGRTPRQFLEELRVERACAALRADLGVARCAYRCGFRSPTSFAAFFRKHLGCTPTQWRRLNL
jgi:AraC family transcriptional regulator